MRAGTGGVSLEASMDLGYAARGQRYVFIGDPLVPFAGDKGHDSFW